MAKRFGLWQFHRAATAVRKRQPGLKWWSDEGVGTLAFTQAMRRVTDNPRARGSRKEHPYRPVDAITRCASRFVLRYGLPWRADVYNRVVDRIGDEGAFPGISIKTARLDGPYFRSRAKLKLYCGEFVFDLDHETQVLQRAKKIRSLRQAREQMQSSLELHAAWYRYGMKGSPLEKYPDTCSMAKQLIRDGVEPARRYDGKRDAPRRWTPLARCVACAALTGGKFAASGLFFQWFRRSDNELCDLQGPFCVACHKRFRRLTKLHKEVNETRRLINSYEKELRNARQ